VRVLFNQNISFRLVKKIEAVFPGSEHVNTVGLKNKSDQSIWDYAKRENFVVVTFDSDFYDISVLYGKPPQLIWIKTFDQTTQNLEQILKNHAVDIQYSCVNNCFLVATWNGLDYNSVGCTCG
jgi:predicted nuclease of predicted toxin-antitoxin system